MAKSFLKFSKASGSTKRRVENFFSRGERAMRRQFVAAKRRELRGTVYV
jgi:hypothetical protein